jgi:PKHD-type hydroxylase
MYRQLSNFPYERAFLNRPYTAEVEFTSEEVDRMNDLFSRDELRPANVIGGAIEAGRVSNINFYYPNQATFWIFEKLNYIIELNNSQIWNFDLNGYESFQYTEYPASTGGKYDFHSDIDYTTLHKDDPQTRKLSLTLVLSEPGIDYEGGDFQVLIGPEPITCPQAKGMVILFPSWVLHRVTPVTRGVRKSVVVWVTGSKFH